MNDPDTQLAPVQQQSSAIQTPPTAESQAFYLLQRQAKLLANSSLVPKDYKDNLANCAIAIEIANRLNASPFMVMQNIDIIHGRPSPRSSFLIATVNSSKRFSPLRFRIDRGEKRKITVEYEKWEGPQGARRSRAVKKEIEIYNSACTAYARDLETNEVVEGPTVDIQLAIDEGWFNKDGSKWHTMPEVMLRYRAAAFFARFYAPDIMLGMYTADEMHDLPAEREVTPARPRVQALPLVPGANAPAIEARTEEAAPAPVIDAGEESKQFQEAMMQIEQAESPEQLLQAKLLCDEILNESERTAAKDAVSEQAEALGLKWDRAQFVTA